MLAFACPSSCLICDMDMLSASRFAFRFDRGVEGWVMGVESRQDFRHGEFFFHRLIVTKHGQSAGWWRCGGRERGAGPARFTYRRAVRRSKIYGRREILRTDWNTC